MRAPGCRARRWRVVSPVPIPSSSTRSGSERDRVDGRLLHLLVARDLGLDQLEVGLGLPVKLRGHRRSLSWIRGSMAAAQYHTIDLARLSLRPGQATRLDLRLDPGDLEYGGTEYRFGDGTVDGRLDISSHGRRLRAAAALRGRGRGALHALPGSAEVEIEVDAREVDQPTSNDEELRSPYVTDGVLDAGGRATPWRSRCPRRSSAAPSAPGSARSAACRSTTSTANRTVTRRHRTRGWRSCASYSTERGGGRRCARAGCSSNGERPREDRGQRARVGGADELRAGALGDRLRSWASWPSRSSSAARAIPAPPRSRPSPAFNEALSPSTSTL